MIKFSFSVPSQWTKDETNLKRYIRKDKKISENKSLRLDIYRATCVSVLSVDVDLTWRGRSNAGPSIKFEVLGRNLILEMYDHRHWDYSAGRWEIQK